MVVQRKPGIQASTSYRPTLGPNPFLVREIPARTKDPEKRMPSAVERAWVGSESTFCFDAFERQSSVTGGAAQQTTSSRPDIHVSVADRVHAPTPPPRREPSLGPHRRRVRAAKHALILGTALASGASLVVVTSTYIAPSPVWAWIGTRESSSAGLHALTGSAGQRVIEPREEVSLSRALEGTDAALGPFLPDLTRLGGQPLSSIEAVSESAQSSRESARKTPPDTQHKTWGESAVESAALALSLGRPSLESPSSRGARARALTRRRCSSSRVSRGRGFATGQRAARGSEVANC
jgi:hypothetical protein